MFSSQRTSSYQKSEINPCKIAISTDCGLTWWLKSVWIWCCCLVCGTVVNVLVVIVVLWLLGLSLWLWLDLVLWLLCWLSVGWLRCMWTSVAGKVGVIVAWIIFSSFITVLVDNIWISVWVVVLGGLVVLSSLNGCQLCMRWSWWCYWKVISWWLESKSHTHKMKGKQINHRAFFFSISRNRECLILLPKCIYEIDFD